MKLNSKDVIDQYIGRTFEKVSIESAQAQSLGNTIGALGSYEFIGAVSILAVQRPFSEGKLRALTVSYYLITSYSKIEVDWWAISFEVKLEFGCRTCLRSTMMKAYIYIVIAERRNGLKFLRLFSLNCDLQLLPIVKCQKAPVLNNYLIMYFDASTKDFGLNIYFEGVY